MTPRITRRALGIRGAAHRPAAATAGCVTALEEAARRAARDPPGRGGAAGRSVCRRRPLAPEPDEARQERADQRPEQQRAAGDAHEPARGPEDGKRGSGGGEPTPPPPPDEAAPPARA